MWHGLFVGGGVAAFNPSMEIIKIFPVVFMAAGQPYDMAVFTADDDPNDDGKRDFTFYFSPSAAFALKKHFPQMAPCEKPKREGLGLHAGDQRCWPILFP